MMKVDDGTLDTQPSQQQAWPLNQIGLFAVRCLFCYDPQSTAHTSIERSSQGSRPGVRQEIRLVIARGRLMPIL